MNRTKIITWAGCLVAGLGMLFCLCGNSFSSQWQSLGDGATPTMALAFRTLGNVTLLLGFVLLAGATWIWLNAKERELNHPPETKTES
jgi:hypothetical protein